jgi:TonB-dependent SusC/RagA subfamily outer membrane receptor
MRIKLFLIILLSVICINSISAQSNEKKITITGSVLDVDKRPIPNAIIMIDDQKTSSITDAEGNYKVRAKPNASKIGIFTFGNGYFEEEIGGRTLIDINFKTVAFKQGPDWNIVPGELDKNGRSENNSYYRLMGLQGKNILTGEESVEVGYAHIKKKYLTTNITYIDAANIKYASCHSINDMLQRASPGMLGTLNLSGNVSPLVVIDGTYCSLSDIDLISPATVESISILKGTSAAIYGQRGYGGAIIIKTKTW